MKNLLGIKNIKVKSITGTKETNDFIEKHDGNILDITPIYTKNYGAIFYVTYVETENK